MKKYILSEKQLEKLLMDSLKFSALDIGGVDNWIGYSDSLYNFLKDEEIDNYEKLVERIIKNYPELTYTESALLP